MQKEKIGVLFIDSKPKTTRDGNEYLTGVVEGDETHGLLAYLNTSKNGRKYWTIYKVERDERYVKPSEIENATNFSDIPVDPNETESDPLADLPF